MRRGVTTFCLPCGCQNCSASQGDEPRRGGGGLTPTGTPMDASTDNINGAKKGENHFCAWETPPALRVTSPCKAEEFSCGRTSDGTQDIGSQRIVNICNRCRLPLQKARMLGRKIFFSPSDSLIDCVVYRISRRRLYFFPAQKQFYLLLHPVFCLFMESVRCCPVREPPFLKSMTARNLYCPH